MATTTYFDEAVLDALTEKAVSIDFGTSSVAGDGPQVYLRVGGGEILFSHENARKFFEASENIARYMGYSRV